MGGGIADRIHAVVLAEGAREIEVREGDKVSRMTAFEGLMRSMYRKAAQGDAKTQRELIGLISRAESERTAAARANLEETLAYQQDAYRRISEAEKAGQPPPKLSPHPDDFCINYAPGEVTIDGPLTAEEAGAQEAFHAIAVQNVGRYFEVEDALAEDPTNVSLRKELAELQKYKDFLVWSVDRWARHEALRQARAALAAKDAVPKAEANKGAKRKDKE